MKMKTGFRLPEPTGEYKVGAKSLTLRNGNRPIPVIAWYPAGDASGCALRQYIPPQLGTELSTNTTNSYENAPFADREEACPVLLFSHGYAMYNEANTVQMEELASRGYIVLSIGHIGEGAYLLDDGVLAQVDAEIAGQLQSASAGSADSYKELVASVDAGEQGYFEKLGTLLDKSAFLTGRAEVWAQDALYVLSQLAGGTMGELSANADLSKVGAFGMSFGGAMAAHLAMSDARITAFASLDGMLYSGRMTERIGTPSLLMQNGGEFRDYLRGFYRFSAADACIMTFKNSAHANFTDLSVLTEPGDGEGALPDGILGEIDGAWMARRINDYLAAFFDRHLRGIFSKILETDIEDEDIAYESRRTTG